MTSERRTSGICSERRLPNCVLDHSLDARFGCGHQMCPCRDVRRFGHFKVMDPRHANLYALVHASAPLSTVVSGTQNGHLDRSNIVAPHRSKFSLASSTRGARRSNMWSAFSHETDRWIFTTVQQHNKKEPTYSSKNI